MSLLHPYRVRLAVSAALLAASSLAGAPLVGAPLAAQSPTLPVVRAGSKVADLLEGDVLMKGAWHIVPEVRPDVYVVRHVGRGKRVALYTDVDSIAFDVTRGSTHDFVVLLGRDSAFSRITAVDPEPLRWDRTGTHAGATADTIPFRLGRGNKIYIDGRVNGSGTLDLMFDTGADAVVLSKSGQRKAGALTVDGAQENAAFGGTTTVRTSRRNVLEIAGLRWPELPLLLIDRADADGIVGYRVFDDRVVTIDYGRRILVVTDTAPSLPPEWAAFGLRWENGLPFLPVTLVHRGGERTGWLEFDTGAAWGAFVSADLARSAGIDGRAEGTRTRSSSGLGPKRVTTDLVRLDAMRFGSHALRDVPVDVERPSGERRRGDGILGMDVLRRFDAVLDLRESRLYLKPNALAAAPYAALATRWGPIVAIALAVLAALAATAVLAVRLRRRSRGVSSTS